MYCAYDKNKSHVVAIHDDRKIVEKYCRIITKFHLSSLEVMKVSKKKIKKMKDYSDLYLIRVGDTYIQTGYLVYLQMSPCEEIKYDHQYCLDVLLRILELKTISKKEEKHILKTVEFMKRLLQEDEEYVPDLYLLEQMKENYSTYMNNI